jgi:hypothetical protein
MISILALLIVTAVAYLIWYLTGLLPIPSGVKQVIQIIEIIVAILWLLQLITGIL